MQRAGRRRGRDGGKRRGRAALLDREGLRYRVVDLNLDEIFAAYVAGVNDDDAGAAMSVEELAPQR